MRRGDKVTGWFGFGIVTDVPEFDNVVRIKQRDKRGELSARYVLKSDCNML